jgi:hypothetical protein
MVKTAPQVGHLTLASFDVPAHPKEQISKRINAGNRLNNFAHFLISGRPFFKLFDVRLIMGIPERSMKNSE